jgi:23S rRNA (cytosine1962-C5)-methyltransferase
MPNGTRHEKGAKNTSNDHAKAMRKAATTSSARVSFKGAQRWAAGHPWIFRSDLVEPPSSPPGAVTVFDSRHKPLGMALWSPHSEISLRLLDTNPDATINAEWWHDRIARAIQRRKSLDAHANAFRLLHAEGDAVPSLVCDRYDRWLVVQLLSAGIEQYRNDILTALVALTGPDGILARNDPPVRAREGLARETTLLVGDVPQEIEVHEHGIRYIAAPWTGQKTGAFLDQREARARVAKYAHGRALDCFSYHGSFALHLARKADHVTAIDSSRAALERAAQNADRNGLTNIACVEANAFDYLRDQERARARFDTIVLDPPAFAKTRQALTSALRGYHEINLRAMKLLAPGGTLYTASCSYHLTKPLFLEMIERAAADSGRRLALRECIGQALDHPEVLTIPETGYIKGAILEALD